MQIKVVERTVAFAHSFVTVRSAQRCPLGCKMYYELEILERDDQTADRETRGKAEQAQAHR